MTTVFRDLGPQGVNEDLTEVVNMDLQSWEGHMLELLFSWGGHGEKGLSASQEVSPH